MKTGTQIEQHITIVGWLHIVGGVFFLVIGGLIFMLLASIGAVSGDAQATAILSVVATFVGLVMTVLALPGIVAGYGLIKHQSWGRYLTVVVAIFELLNFPLGTIIGVYSLWVLMSPEGMAYFEPKMAT